MTPKKVAILAYPNLCTFEFACAVELFALPRPDISNWYQCDIISTEKKPITATGGFKISTDHLFQPDKGFIGYDMLVIAGWSGLQIRPSNTIIHAMKAFHAQGGRIITFCSGAFALAATGLLSNKTATTHWRYENTFKQLFPDILFQQNVLFTQEHNLYTSAGSAAALDLGLHIIQKDYGTSIANKVAKRLVVSPKREGGQAQYATHTTTPKQYSSLTNCLTWAKENLNKTLSINEMAEKACLSRRSFDRHFRAHLGLSPKAWLIKQRIDLARDYLESTNLSIEQVAEACGFGSAMNLRHHFSEQLKVSPSHYRRQFLRETRTHKNA